MIGIQTPGREDHADQPALRRMDALVDEIAAILPCEKPYFLYGHSMGAAIAAELALELQRRGRNLPRALIVSGSNPPAARRGAAVHDLPEAEFIEQVMQNYASPHAAETRAPALLKIQTLLRADLELFETYAPSAGLLNVPVAALHARQDPLVEAQAMRGWAALSTGDFLLRSLDGNHQIVTGAPENLARALQQAMDVFGPET